MAVGISNEYKIVVMKMEFCTPNNILWITHNQLRRTLSLYVVILLIFPSFYCTEKIIYFKHIIVSASVIISVDEFCTPPTPHLSFIYSWSISHILDHELFYLGRLGRLGQQWRKIREYIWATLEGSFFIFLRAKLFLRIVSKILQRPHQKIDYNKSEIFF